MKRVTISSFGSIQNRVPAAPPQLLAHGAEGAVASRALVDAEGEAEAVAGPEIAGARMVADGSLAISSTDLGDNRRRLPSSPPSSSIWTNRR